MVAVKTLSIILLALMPSLAFAIAFPQAESDNECASDCISDYNQCVAEGNSQPGYCDTIESECFNGCCEAPPPRSQLTTRKRDNR
jgi:hypothetical protein